MTGAWFQVGGNLTAAIGTTRGFIGEEKVESDLVIVGKLITSPRIYITNHCEQL